MLRRSVGQTTGREVFVVAKKLAIPRRRKGWLMSDTDRQIRDFEAAVERRSSAPDPPPAKRSEQLFDEIEVEDEER